MGHLLRIEPLEPRALLATISASATISSTPVAGGYSYTIALANSSTSNSAIGTFWFAWVPGQDYLATNPISVTPPAGWTDQVTNNGSADGYAIQFVSTNPANDVQPGSSMNYSFTSTDAPASVEGTSAFYPSTPVGTSIVYPGVPGTDAGHELVVTAAAPAATLASIAIAPANPTIALGKTDQFSAIGTFSDGSTQNLTGQVTWASSTPSMATISDAPGSQGLATTVAQGAATISATLNGIKGSTVLAVNPPVLESIALSALNPFDVIGKFDPVTATGTFSDGSTQNLTTAVTWGSDTPSVATISNNSGSQGMVTGVLKGTTTISATLDGFNSQTTITVTPVLDSIAITPAAPTLPKGESEGFIATGTFADNSTENLTDDVTWSSANPAAATISNAGGSMGVASALAIGTSSISANFEGVTGSTSLQVTPAVLRSISVTPASPTIIEGQNDQFSASGTYSDNSTQDLTGLVSWASDTGSVATISSTGLASGIIQGTSNISATYQGITGSKALVVDPPLVKLTSAAAILKRNKVTQVVLTFSGSLEPDLAQDRELYRFVVAGKKGVFTATKGTVIRVGKAQYTAASPDTVTLSPMTPFRLSRTVEIRINGLPPSGLKDSAGRFIDGDNDGQAGGNAAAVVV
jgi:hypothetical protein